MQDVEEQEPIVKARKEYREGDTKSGISAFSPEIIRMLADELGVKGPLLKSGKCSMSKANLVDALVEKVCFSILNSAEN